MNQESKNKQDFLWQTKLHARLHDPMEKSMLLLQGSTEHATETPPVTHRPPNAQGFAADTHYPPEHDHTMDAILFKEGIPESMHKHIQQADQWASWPQLPTRESSVHWQKNPILIHPFSGQQYKLQNVSNVDMKEIKKIARDHFTSLRIQKTDGATDWHKTLLAYWRFGPELSEEEKNQEYLPLWPLLPADARSPDHSIFEHLDLCSAFAGAFAADAQDQAALLAFSIGPVQKFISAARSTSDLWAGSHLLAHLAWEAMKVICRRLGPDAILMPSLRGIPLVDLWLRDEMQLGQEAQLNKRFARCSWARQKSDSNPLFTATLPNRFMALVPESEAQEICQQMKKATRDWLQRQGKTVVDRLLKKAGENSADQENLYCYQQMRTQLEGFPECHWASVPFSLIEPGNQQKQTGLHLERLQEIMQPFYAQEAWENGQRGFFSSPSWKALKKENARHKIKEPHQQPHKKALFYAPNPGTLYPVIYDLVKRFMATAKAVHPFPQTEQKGWRCSLTGESEWLTTDAEQLMSYRPKTDTLWSKIAKKQPSWVIKGEHLGALSAIKRIWPTLFSEQLSEQLSNAPEQKLHRFVVSTHTMAIAGQLENWLERGLPGKEEFLQEEMSSVDSTALPAKIIRACKGDQEKLRYITKLPALLENYRKQDTPDPRTSKICSILFKNNSPNESAKPENYYALLLMDGDRMGKMLAGAEEFSIPYKESLHPDLQENLASVVKGNQEIAQYLDSKRLASPSRHTVISTALGNFALHVARHIIEKQYLGRIIYAGGDDILAILPVTDLLSAMQDLRYAYSGSDGYFHIKNKKLPMRMMGKATASCGAVVAHYQAPLATALRELRAAEQRAKEGGRNAFGLTILKRAGGALYIKEKFHQAPLLAKLRNFLSKPGVSHRAVYNCLLWLRDIPHDADPHMLRKLLAYQFSRQIDPKRKTELDASSQALVKELVQAKKEHLQDHSWLENFLCVAEFLAREVRSPFKEIETPVPTKTPTPTKPSTEEAR